MLTLTLPFALETCPRISSSFSKLISTGNLVSNLVSFQIGGARGALRIIIGFSFVFYGTPDCESKWVSDTGVCS